MHSQNCTTFWARPFPLFFQRLFKSLNKPGSVGPRKCPLPDGWNHTLAWFGYQIWKCHFSSHSFWGKMCQNQMDSTWDGIIHNSLFCSHGWTPSSQQAGWNSLLAVNYWNPHGFPAGNFNKHTWPEKEKKYPKKCQTNQGKDLIPNALFQNRVWFFGAVLCMGRSWTWMNLWIPSKSGILWTAEQLVTLLLSHMVTLPLTWHRPRQKHSSALCNDKKLLRKTSAC